MGKKVIVPEFVADWYEQTGKYNEWFNWFYRWGRGEEESMIESWVLDWMQDFNEKAFVDMFHNGYEIAEEIEKQKMHKDTRFPLQKIKDERRFYEMFAENELDEWDRGYLEGLEFAMESIDRLDDSLLSEVKRITDSYKKGATINKNE